MRLDGKVALISGAARGMGASHARKIVEHGGKVLLGDILDDETASLAEELGGDNARAVHLDVRSTADWATAVDQGNQAFGVINVLVNNAGILHASPIEDYSDEDWQRILDVNVTGAFKGIRAVTPTMKNMGGSIINISSVAGLRAFPRVIGYVTGKFALRGMTKSAAIELAQYDIRVNSVHPGNVSTDMIDGLHEHFKHVPMQRPGTPHEISELVVFLASDESSFSTGAEFIADGGETAGMKVY